MNTGGGIMTIWADGLPNSPNFQSTLQHELGHAFGLVHVDSYGYSMQTNPSIMSYNLTHHTRGLKPSATPGIFIPEDYRVIARNRRVFPELKMDEEWIQPENYQLSSRPVLLSPMKIQGQPDYTGPDVLR